jgi:hypothetical protein
MSSFTAHPSAYDADDWQLVNSPRPYEASKFQIDLIRAELSRRAGPSARVRHFTVDPGAVDTSISAALDNGLLAYLKVLMLYLVRFFIFVHVYVTESACLWAGSVARPIILQYLSVEWCHLCRLRLPRSARVYSGLFVGRWGTTTRYAREGAEDGWCGAPGVPSFCD